MSLDADMVSNRSVLLVPLFAAMLLASPASARPAVPALARPADLASRIDARLAARWKADKVRPAPLAGDAEFVRRVWLDLNGRIPRPADVHEFLADTSPNKRSRLIDRLLAEPRFAVHFANAWRAELLPEAAANPQAALLRPGFENWLAGRFRAGVRYDRLVRELIAVPITSDKDGEPVLRAPERPNPLAFIAAKEARPENLAAAVSRSFLGIRLECAQCHDHPFARWTQGQFWSQAAFFVGLRKRGNSLFAPLTEDVQRRELTPPGKTRPRQAEFLLAGDKPKWSSDRPPRAVLADWITSPDNPFFARAAVNRMWCHFFGRGLVDPPDDFRDDNPPSDAALLDDLARAFVGSGFDLQFLVRAICLSKAYQRTSACTDPSQDRARPAARMTVKALTGEQLFDSLALATGYREVQDKGLARRRFLTRFALAGSAAEPETSIQQALTLLNGRFIAWATDPERCPTLLAVTQTPWMSTRQRIEALYLASLSRKPTAEEVDRLERYVRKAKPEREAERLADVFWVLLNSAEFRLNH
jgi:hypothetical protein